MVLHPGGSGSRFATEGDQAGCGRHPLRELACKQPASAVADEQDRATPRDPPERSPATGFHGLLRIAIDGSTPPAGRAGSEAARPKLQARETSRPQAASTASRSSAIGSRGVRGSSEAMPRWIHESPSPSRKTGIESGPRNASQPGFSEHVVRKVRWTARAGDPAVFPTDGESRIIPGVAGERRARGRQATQERERGDEKRL